jgi:hypothetical protein
MVGAEDTVTRPFPVVVLLQLLCLALVPGSAAYAGDEDLSSSAYLVFDPETGEFVTVQDPNRTKGNHEAVPKADDSASAATPHGQAPGESTLPLAAGSAVAVAALAGAIVWIRRRKRAAS